MESMIVLLGANILDYVDKHMYLFQAYTGRPAGFTGLQVNYRLNQVSMTTKSCIHL